MPLYIGDYLGDTGHLTTTQHGAYLLLLMHYWMKGELPDEDKQLSKITKLPLKVWTEYRETIQDFFYDGWKHKRIEAELRKMMEVREKRALAGQKGGFWSAIAAQKRKGNPSLSERVYRQANATQEVSKSAASVHHSQSQSKKKEGLANGKDEKPPLTASPELAEILARKQSA